MTRARPGAAERLIERLKAEAATERQRRQEAERRAEAERARADRMADLARRAADALRR